jgi:hypothetical protein
MNKPKLLEFFFYLSVKFYRNLRRNLFYGIYFNKFHARYARGNFKNVTIDLAIHSHSAPIFRLRCISIAQKKSYIYSGGFKGGFGGFRLIRFCSCYCSDPWALYKTAKTYIHLTRCSWCNFFKFVVLYLQLWFCRSRYYCSNVPGF